MIRVLVVDDQKFVCQSLKTLLERKQEIEVVGTAADGQAALEQVETLHPDVVLIDLHMPVMDGVTAIREIAQHFEATKALVFSSHQDHSSIIEALRAGAKGYLLKGASADDLAVAVQSVYRGYTYLGPGLLEKTMVDPSSPQLSLPIAKLQSWTYWITNEVIAQWRRQAPKKSLSVKAFVNELGLSSEEKPSSLLKALERTTEDTSVSLELISRFRALQQEQQQRKLKKTQLYEWLEQASASLAQWFSRPPLGSPDLSQSPVATDSCLAQLRANALRLLAQLMDQFTTRFQELAVDAGPLALLQWLGDLEKTLQKLHTSHETQRQDCLYQEKSAWRAYNTLSVRLTDPHWQGTSFNSDEEAPLRALSLAYGHKLKGEIHALAAQLIRDLIRKAQQAAEEVKKVDTLLVSWQDWLAEHCSMQSAFLPLLSLYVVERVSPSELRHRFENQIGHRFNEWANLPATQRAPMLEQLLAHVRHLSEELYTECCQAALSLNTSAHKPLVDSQNLQRLDTPLGAMPSQIPEVSADDLEQYLQELEKSLPQQPENTFIQEETVEISSRISFPLAEVVDESGTILSTGVSVFGERETLDSDHTDTDSFDHSIS